MTLLTLLLRLGRSKADAAALLGDLDEEYRDRLRSGRGRLRARAWYAREAIVAVSWEAADRLKGRAASQPNNGMRRRWWLWRLLDPADVRLALRRWRRRPGVAITTILTLALGIGTTTAIFSVVDAVILRPWAWPEADRLAVVHAVFPNRLNDPARATTWNRAPLTWPMWDALRGASGFEDVAVWQAPPFPNTTFGEARMEMVSMTEVSSNLLPMLGARLLHGRHFNVEDDQRPTNTTILPYETWRRRFGARPDVIGETVMTGSASSGGRQPRTVIGVLGSGLNFPTDQPEFFFNIGTAAEVSRTYDGGNLHGLARLKTGIGFDTALVEARTIIEGLQRKEPASARLVPLVDEQLGDAARPLWLLFAGAAILLLVACSNVAGLLLSEGHARRHEFGVRAALGGRPGRAVRQLFAEHSLLAVGGAAAGILVAFWITQGLVAIAPAGLPRVDAVTIDGRIAVFGLGLGGLTLLVFGVAPALTLARTPAIEVLAEGRQRGGAPRHRSQRLLVAAQIALALVLLVGATLFGETILRLTATPLGFDPSNLAVVSTSFTGSRYSDPDALRAALQAAQRDPTVNYRAIQAEQMRVAGVERTERVTARLRALAGVTAVAGTWRGVPFLSAASSGPVHAEGRPASEVHDAQWQLVTDTYFATMGIPVRAGRNFDASDGGGTVQVAVVSEEFERRVLGGTALGRRFMRPPATTALTVVGVVPSVKRQESFTTEDRPTYYMLDRQHAGEIGQFTIRTTSDPARTLPDIRRAIAEVNPQIVVTSTTTMDELLERLRANEHFRATLSACFGGAALLLAAVGLYGLAARRTADRQREFGIRVALGAAPATLRALVVKDVLLIMGAGLLVGLPAAFVMAHSTRSWLFGVSPTSPHIFLLASAVLASVAMVATLVPARRASRLDPVRALKD